MSTTDNEDADNVDAGVEEMTADPGAQLARAIRRQLVDKILSVFAPDGKFLKKFRRQVESHGETLAIQTADKIVESLSSVSSDEYKRAMSAAEKSRQPTSSAGTTSRFKSAAVAVMTANRMQAGAGTRIDLSSQLRQLEKACDSFDRFLLEEGLVGPAQKTIRLAALSAVSVLSGSPADLCTDLDDPIKMLTQDQLGPLLSTVSVYDDMIQTKLQKVKGSSLTRLMRPESAKKSLVDGMFHSATVFTMRKAGFGAYYDMLKAAATFSRMQLSREERELTYVMDRIAKLEQMQVSPENVRDFVDTWKSLLDLIPKISSQRALALLQCLSCDRKLLSALGAGMAVRQTVGEKLPDSISTRLNQDAGSKIRDKAYDYLNELEKERAIVRRTVDHQNRGLALIGSALLSVFITIGSVVGRFYNDAIKDPKQSTLLWLIPAVCCGIVLVCCLCSIAAYQGLKGSSSSSGRGYRLLRR